MWVKTRRHEHVLSLIYDWRDRAHQSDGGLCCQRPAHRCSFPVRTGFTPLSSVLPLGAGTNRWLSSLAEKVMRRDYGSSPLCTRGAPRASGKARVLTRACGPLEASQQPPGPCLCDFLSNILLTRTANFWQNARDSADQMVWAVARSPQPARLVGDLANRVLSPAVLATYLGNKVNFSM